MTTTLRLVTPNVAVHDDWYRDHRNLHELFCWLVDRGELDTLGQVGDFLDEPWKWRPEFRAMREAQQVGADIARLSEMALTPWPGGDAA